MSKNPICEPFTNEPVKFDIKKLIAEFKPQVETHDVADEKGPQDFLDECDKDWRVLPTFRNQLDYLKLNFSVNENKYMKCRWRNFLDNVPEQYVVIHLYRDLLAKPPQPRPLTLNGQFYGVDFKLAPIPVMDDPRTMT